MLRNKLKEKSHSSGIEAVIFLHKWVNIATKTSVAPFANMD